MREVQRLHAKTLIDALHPQPHAGAMIEITGMMPKSRPAKRYLFRSDLAVEAALELNDMGYSAFVSVNPRNAMTGFESSVPYVTALVMDLQPTRTHIGDVYRRLSAAGIPPSIAGISGNGAHAYILLSEHTDPHVAKLQGERLCKVTGSDAVFNTNRIFRLAGTVNWKYPAWCYLQYVSQQRYTLDEVATALDRLGAPPPNPPKPGIHVPIDPPVDWFELRQRLSPSVLDIIDTGEKNAYSEAQVTRSEADWVVICALVRADAPDEMIHWVYEKNPVGIMKYREAGARYLNRTIEAARRATSEPNERAPARAKDMRRQPCGGTRDKHRRY